MSQPKAGPHPTIPKGGGAAGESRTLDLSLTKGVLYH